MTFQKTKVPPTVAISISESPDMSMFGLSDGHLRDAMAEIALQLLASGTSLAYGGDLRAHGFTELLFELLMRYQDHPRHSGKITVTNYLAWPVHIRMTADELAAFSTGHEKSVHIIFLARDGTRLEQEKCLELPVYEPDENEWTEGLTAMRNVMREKTQARIALGGKVDGYKGRMPGIAEETLLSLQSHQPVFLLGGFGGCTRDIAETIGLVDSWAGSRPNWHGRSCFESYSPRDLHNGLSKEDNAILARTPHIHQAITLVSRGLRLLRNESTSVSPEGGENA
ncbi:MAG: hypothetical protein OXF47_02355 [Nitrospira sp.]|nr:hypothetical protein [Nitrospira sp.]MCY4132108.1 hypothetical protein [Nitrospira sp.]